MTDIDPGDYNIGDIVRVAFTDKPLDALAKADIVPDEPAIVEQVRKPTDNELAALEKLAGEAARTQDKLKAAQGSMPGDLKKLRAQLKEQMIRYGMTEVSIDGRPPIELTSSNSRKPTRKAIVAILEEAAEKKLTEEQRRDAKQVKKAKKEGKTKALNLWSLIPQTTSQSVRIPDPSPPEVDSPY
jgi:hypothetical protein